MFIIWKCLLVNCVRNRDEFFLDLLLLGGDLTDIPADAGEYMAWPLKGLNAPMGKYYVTGKFFRLFKTITLVLSKFTCNIFR